MKKFLIAIALALASSTTGCASGTVRTISDQALEQLPVEDRADYRHGLNTADTTVSAAQAALAEAKEVITQAKAAYDAKYNADGTPKAPAPAPVEPVK